MRIKTPMEFFEEAASHMIATSYLWDFPDFSDPMIEDLVKKILNQVCELDGSAKSALLKRIV